MCGEAVTQIGFLGTGVITEAVVSGLCTLAQPPARIIVSPRNAGRASSLSSRFAQVSVAADNQTVVDVSDVVCIAVGADIATTLLGELRFRENQSVVSFLAMISIAELREFVTPASRICRMLPLPPLANHLGPIVLCPPNQEIAALFGGIGTVIEIDDEERFLTLWTVTAMIAPFFGLSHQMSAWLEARNIEPRQARRYVGSMIHALSVTGEQEGERGFERLIDGHSTPKGLNEQGLRELNSAGWLTLIPKVLSLIEERLHGRADFERRME